MTISWLRTAAAVVALLLAGAVAVALILRAGAALTASRTGADPASALHVVPALPDDVDVTTTWLPDPPDPGRVVSPAVRREVTSDLARAWIQLAQAHRSASPDGLDTYFTDRALDAVTEAVAQADGTHRLDVTSHTLSLRFHSADGQVIGLSDELTVGRADVVGDAVIERQQVEAYDVILTLEDGTWRVTHLVRRAVDRPDAR